MAQHDYNVANATGFNFRADLNAALQAVVTQNSGSTAPTVTFPGQLWLDLSAGGDGIMRRRNQANTAWLTDIGVDQTARNAAATAQAKADRAILRDNTATAAERTMALPLILPNTVPAQHEAVSRAQADLLYQVMLPTGMVAGSLLYSGAAGWNLSLAPGSAGALLTVSGGLPLWVSPVSVAAPNSIVRTLSDGTIDPSFIPAVASGLRFRGTFRPAVNFEYPTTGGSGTGGAPAVGDFWVIDGLTTGGFTYLTGSLAGVTVFNGDSIAFDGTLWYRMGSSVALDGYMKTDGSTAMTGNLDLGTHDLVNAGNIVGRAGNPLNISNYKLDATNVIVSPQRGQTGPDLAAMATGQIGTDLGRMQIFVGASGSNTGLLPVRFHSTTAAYVTGDHVVSANRLYRAPGAIAAGAFTPSQWVPYIDAAGGVFTGPISIASPSEIRYTLAGVTRARAYVDSTGSYTIGAYDNTGANPVALMAFDYATQRGFLTSLYVGNSAIFNGQMNIRVYSGYISLVFQENLVTNRFYMSGDASQLAMISFADDGASMGHVLMRWVRAVGGNPPEVQVLRQLRVLSFGGDNAQGITYFGQGNTYLWFDATNFRFSHPVIGPSFTPVSDARVKANLRAVKARGFDELELFAYNRIDDGDRATRGTTAQQVRALGWHEYVRELPPMDEGGEPTLALDMMGLTFEMVMNLRDRVAALETNTTH